MLNSLMALGSAILICGAGFAALITPFAVGNYFGSRINNRLLAGISVTLAVVWLGGSDLLYLSFSNHFQYGYWPMVLVFLPMYMGVGLFAGRAQKNINAANERKLENWRNQVLADREAGAQAVRLSADYRQIATLLGKLGRREEAADEYRHAIALLESVLMGHPSMAQYYDEYLRLLPKKQNSDEIARVTAKRDALRKL